MFSFSRCNLRAHWPLLLVGLVAAACGSDENNGAEDDGSGAGTGTEDTPGLGPGVPGSPPVAADLPPAAAAPGGQVILAMDEAPPGAPVNDDGKPEVCSAQAYGVEQLPPDIFIMLDQSVSMDKGLEGTNATRWQGVTEAIRAFVNDPAARNVGVGLQYFGLTANEDCDPMKYSVPDVEIGKLPGVADAMVASLDTAAGPSTFTPTYPALEGALMHAKQHAAANPATPTAVLLATDGFPFTSGVGDCNDSVKDIAALAEEASGWDPPVRVYLVGVSEGLANLASIAEKGGGRAYLIDQGDIKEQFTKAMLNIVTTPLGCELELPDAEGASLDPSLVSVTVSVKGEKHELYKIGSQADCNNPRLEAGRGWYYDNDADPKNIHICEDACREFVAGQAHVALGCPSLTLVPQ